MHFSIRTPQKPIFSNHFDTTKMPMHQMWVPYDTPKDCSQGFCSIYCPQWCYIVFPPPPPLGFDDDISSSSANPFSPLVIAIIAVLASAFLLVSYYTIISKYCGTFSAIGRRLRRRPDVVNVEVDDHDGSPSIQQEQIWHVAPSHGLDEALISKISMYMYKRGEGVVDGTDCSVCLSEFREDESLRLLPKCSHAFHLQCIDTWLRSHSNCPLCRANIVAVAAPVAPSLPPPQLETNNAAITEEASELVIPIEDINREGEDEPSIEDDLDEHSSDVCKDIVEVEIAQDGHEGVGFRPVPRSFSMNSSCHGRISIADVLQISMEDEILAAKDRGLFVEAGSSRRVAGELSKADNRCRSLHSVMSPVAMKRSFSSGRFCFSKGRNSILPI